LKRPELLLIAALFAVAGFVGLQVYRAPRRAAVPVPVAYSTSGSDIGETGGLARIRRSALPAPVHDYADIAQKLADAKGSAYIDEVLAERDGNVARWVDRRDDPVRVWVQPRSTIKDWWSDFPERTRDAFYTWAAAGIPIRFLFIDDSAAAEVRVRWVDHFAEAAGKTYWARDQNWWIVEADVEIAVHRSSGEAFDGLAVRTITLHEVGHVIGLDHSHNADDVMSARVHATALTAADLGTASLVYHLPPGSVTASGATAAP
jgi:hypothetical protein